MKKLFTLLLFVCSFTLSAQVEGNYDFKTTTKDGDVVDYELTLSADGTFSFHYYSNIKNGIPPEKNHYGKGKWTVEKNVVSFISDKQTDLDEKHTLDFTGSKTRFFTKSPKDKTDKVVKTRLKFLSSGIFWVKGLEVFKK